MSRLAALLVVALLLAVQPVLSCASPPPSATPPPPTPDINATVQAAVTTAVQAAVATAVAQERQRVMPTPTPIRATALPAPTKAAAAAPAPTKAAAAAPAPTKATASNRDAWLRAGREFFAIEADAVDIEELSLRVLTSEGTFSPPVSALQAAAKRVNALQDRIFLLPLPPEPGTQSIRDNLRDAGNELVKQFGLADALSLYARNKTPPPDALRSSGSGFMDFSKAWGKPRSQILEKLQEQGISMSDLGLSN